MASVPLELQTEVTGTKTRRSSMGGWSQARYQRRAENLHQQHIKEVVETLDGIVRRDNIQHIIVAGDDVVVSLLRDAMPKHLVERLVDVLKLDRHAGEDAIVEATLEALRQKDAATDAERVREVVDAWHSGGLGVAGSGSDAAGARARTGGRAPHHGVAPGAEIGPDAARRCGACASRRRDDGHRRFGDRRRFICPTSW